MPKFPTRNDIENPGSLRSGRHYVQASEIDGSAQFAGLKKVGAAIAGLGGVLAEREEKAQAEQNALDLLKAEQIHQRGLIDLDRSLENDADYATHDKRFQEGAGGVTDKAAGLIRDEKTREKWKLRAGVENERGRGQVLNRTDNLMRDQRQGELRDTLTGYVTTYTDPKSTPEQRMAARKAIDDAIIIGSKAGLLNPREERAIRQEFTHGIEADDIKRRMIDEPEQLLRDLETSGADRKAPGLKTPGNIDLTRRPVVKNADGTISTLKSVSVNIGGLEVLLPTIGPDGKELDVDGAVKQFEQTGQHLGMFDTPENATAYAKTLSERMGRKAGGAAKAIITAQLETGQTDPLAGVGQIAGDTNGSKSYGNFGLNSQGSLQEFVADYASGDDANAAGISFKSKPGSKAFDKEWRAWAQSDPEALHALEMSWFQEKILPRISGELAANGVPADVADDPRVQAYFADRMVQYGPHSNKSYSQRISRAAEAADGDPTKFLREMSNSDAANIDSDFRSYLADRPSNRRGLGNRISGRERLSLGTVESEQPGGMYPTLSPLERTTYINETRTKMRAAAEMQRSQFKQMLEADVESVRKTGRGVRDFDLEGASQVLEKSQISKWDADRAEAQYEYDSLHDLDGMGDSQLTQRLTDLRPASGDPHFDIKQKVFDEADKRIRSIREMRIEDPARAVTSDPGVQAAQEAAAAALGEPQAVQNLVRARLDAQAKVGIPEGLRSPVTVQEARVMAARVKGLSGQELTAGLLSLQEELDTTYGPYAQAAGVAVQETIVRDRDLADSVNGMLRRVYGGKPPTAAQLRKTEILNEGMLALEAMGGSYISNPMAQYGIGRSPDGIERGTVAPGPLNTYYGYYGFAQPPLGARIKLQRNPGLAAQFNAKYGDGAAAAALATPITDEELAAYEKATAQ